MYHRREMEAEGHRQYLRVPVAKVGVRETYGRVLAPSLHRLLARPAH